jgi:hypothetical protein
MAWGATRSRSVRKHPESAIEDPPELSILCTSGVIDMSATDGAESAF